MTDWELLAILAGLASASGDRSVEGAVAHARELIDELRRQEPELYESRIRARLADAQLRRTAR